MWMQWKMFGGVSGELELPNAAINVACAEGPGDDGGGQDDQGLSGFGVRLCWGGSVEGVSLHQVREEKEERSGIQCEDCWLGHLGAWSVCGWNGEGAAGVTAGSGSATEAEAACPSGLSASQQSLQWRC